MPPSEEASRTFSASLEEVREAASDALASLGAKVEVGEDGMSLSGTTGWTLFSFWGEGASSAAIEERGGARDRSQYTEGPDSPARPGA